MVDSPSIQRQRPDSRLGTNTSVCGDGAETTASCGPLVAYDYHQRAMQVHEAEMMGHPMAGMWYPPPMPPPPMPPMFMCAPPPPNPKEMRKAIKAAVKMEKQRLEMQKKPSACHQYCCEGIAQLLWIIIAVIVFGALVAVLFTLIMI
uniref:Membrane protein V1 n=1 Tax=Steinernema glaseri TaxID=37863 RepID=A0A1I7YJM5_9BILA